MRSRASRAAATHAFQGIARRPLSPVHVSGTRDGQGNLTIRWIRRTRSGGDNWDVNEVALGEEAEAYEVDILQGEIIVRTLAASSPEAAYAAGDQAADFGTPQQSVTCRVFQIGAAWGRGAPRTAIV